MFTANSLKLKRVLHSMQPRSAQNSIDTAINKPSGFQEQSKLWCIFQKTVDNKKLHAAVHVWLNASARFLCVDTTQHDRTAYHPDFKSQTMKSALAWLLLLASAESQSALLLRELQNTCFAHVRSYPWFVYTCDLNKKQI